MGFGSQLGPVFNDKTQKKIEITNQEKIAKLRKEQENNLLRDGNLIENVALDTTVSTFVSHKLGKKYQGYVIVEKDANAVIYTDTATEFDKTKFLKLKTSANTTVTIWVF